VDAKGHPAPLDPNLALGDPFTVQVAALSDPANVVRLSKELKAAIGPVNLQEAQTKGGVKIQRVRVGSYDHLEDAQKAADEISKRFRDRGLEPFITREH
jgi:cell division septation protein DedD